MQTNKQLGLNFRKNSTIQHLSQKALRLQLAMLTQVAIFTLLGTI